MDYLIPIFAIATTGVLCGLCLIVLEYQNGRTRKMSRIWVHRVQDPALDVASASSAEALAEEDPQAA